MLLPKAETERLGDEDLSDPRSELIRQLLEYKKFKDAANMFNAVADEHLERFGRPDSIIEQFKPDAEQEVDLDQVTIWDLLEAFDNVCKAIGNPPDISRIKDDTPIDLYQIEILHRLQTEGPLIFQRIFEACIMSASGDARTKRIIIVGHFLAILELIREKLICLEQPTPVTIYLRAMTEIPAEQAVQDAILLTKAERESRMETHDAEFADRPAQIVGIESPKEETESPEEIDEPVIMENDADFAGDEEDMEIMQELSQINDPQEIHELEEEQKTSLNDEAKSASGDPSSKPPISINELPSEKTITEDAEVENQSIYIIINIW
jgi:chromatin segregation and condensation protein Rec8/ScpA/Scc1 (kleisin family)